MFMLPVRMLTPRPSLNTLVVISAVPPIASSRIDSYDGHLVTFHYTRHEDDKTVSETNHSGPGIYQKVDRSHS